MIRSVDSEDATTFGRELHPSNREDKGIPLDPILNSKMLDKIKISCNT